MKPTATKVSESTAQTIWKIVCPPRNAMLARMGVFKTYRAHVYPQGGLHIESWSSGRRVSPISAHKLYADVAEAIEAASC